MKDFLKNKVVTALIIIGTVILAGVAIFTALRLYQLRTRPVAPTAPESTPAASEEPQPEACQQLAFTLTVPSITPTPTIPVTTTPQPSLTPTSVPSPTLTPTVTPPVGGQPSSTPTPTKVPTTTPIPTTTQISTATSTPTPPILPTAGVTFPTLILLSASLLLIILSLVIAL